MMGHCPETAKRAERKEKPFTACSRAKVDYKMLLVEVVGVIVFGQAIIFTGVTIFSMI